ncbi:hypothetical protein BH11BAC4_BH11BAC4_11940 [soil metagenome]
MVSLRGKMIVNEELEQLGLPDGITAEQREKLKKNLPRSGLELLDDEKAILIDKIKNVIIEMIHYSDKFPGVNCADYISKKLNYNYTYLTNIFSEVKGITMQHFIIIHEIEKVKELLLYDHPNHTATALKLNYMSMAQPSKQFKKKQATHHLFTGN